MAGDPLRDAFRTALGTVVTEQSILWPIKDTLNTATQPAPPAAGVGTALAGHLELEFLGGGEEQYTFGAGTSDLHREQGQVTVRVATRLRAGTTKRDLAESYARGIRNGFRKRRFTTSTGREVRITAVAPMGGGFDEAGFWVESVALGYETFNLG